MARIYGSTGDFISASELGGRGTLVPASESTSPLYTDNPELAVGNPNATLLHGGKLYKAPTAELVGQLKAAEAQTLLKQTPQEDFDISLDTTLQEASKLSPDDVMGRVKLQAKAASLFTAAKAKKFQELQNSYLEGQNFGVFQGQRQLYETVGRTKDAEYERVFKKTEALKSEAERFATQQISLDPKLSEMQALIKGFEVMQGRADAKASKEEARTEAEAIKKSIREEQAKAVLSSVPPAALEVVKDMFPDDVSQEGLVVRIKNLNSQDEWKPFFNTVLSKDDILGAVLGGNKVARVFLKKEYEKEGINPTIADQQITFLQDFAAQPAKTFSTLKMNEELTAYKNLESRTGKEVNEKRAQLLASSIPKVISATALGNVQTYGTNSSYIQEDPELYAISHRMKAQNDGKMPSLLELHREAIRSSKSLEEARIVHGKILAAYTKLLSDVNKQALTNVDIGMEQKRLQAELGTSYLRMKFLGTADLGDFSGIWR